MLGFGRPSHVYDLAKLTGAVVARRAKDGEQVMALNDKVYALTSEMTVIADDSGVHDIAGIMGGAHSGCSDDTTDVLLEIAYFTPERIAKTGQALALTSDARTRFERGVDPGFMGYGIELVTSLILEICGGVASEIVKAGELPLEPRKIAFVPMLTVTLGGVSVDDDTQRAILTRLGFTVDLKWNVTVPTGAVISMVPPTWSKKSCGSLGWIRLSQRRCRARTVWHCRPQPRCNRWSARCAARRLPADERSDQLVVPTAERG